MKKSTYNLAHGQLQNKQTDITLFDHCKQRFYHAIKWNTVEAVLYHALYFFHQLGLYALIATHDYGKYGSLLSFSFLCVPLLMGALDIALIAHIKQVTNSKDSFREFIKKHIIPQFLFMCLMPLLLYVGVISQLTATINYLSFKECLLVGTFIALESCKKLLRRILQLLFYNKYTTAVEVASIALYMAIFWGAIFWGIKPSLFLVIIPFLLTSIPALIFFGIIFYHYYQTLPEDSHNEPLPSVFSTQLPAFANQISRSLFSSNLLIPLFVGWVGFTQAGIAALAKNITYTLTYFLHKICSPVAAFLSDTKDLGEEKQKDAFLLSIKIFFIVAFIGLFGLILYNGTHHANLSFLTLFYMCFFFIVHLLEHLFTLYEKFFIAQNKGNFLLVCNIVSSLLGFTLFTLLQSLNFIILIILVFSIRILLIIGLSCLIFSPKYVPFLSYWYKTNPK